PRHGPPWGRRPWVSPDGLNLAGAGRREVLDGPRPHPGGLALCVLEWTVRMSGWTEAQSIAASRSEDSQGGEDSAHRLVPPWGKIGGCALRVQRRSRSRRIAETASQTGRHPALFRPRAG